MKRVFGYAQLITFSGALALAACADPDNVTEDEQLEDQAPVDYGVTVDNIAEESVPDAYDADNPLLETLGTAQDVDLGPALGACSFAIGDETLLMVGTPIEDGARGKGVIQVAGVDRLLAGTRGYGPDGIQAGPTMTDGEFTVRVVRADGEGEVTGRDTTSWDARLFVRKDAGEEIPYGPGTWSCGV